VWFWNLCIKTKNFVLCVILLLCSVSELQKPSLLGLKPWKRLKGCGFCSCNFLLTETNNFILDTILSCLVSDLQKTSSLVIEIRSVCQGCDLCFCDLYETSNFALKAFLLLLLVSKLQQPLSPWLEFRMFFSFCLSKISFYSHKISIQISLSILEI
jgi:hypothetical protein